MGADDAKLLPGYGWIFGMGDGTVNVGLGVLNSSASFQRTDYRAMLTRWLDATPEAWGLREVNATGPIRGAGLPMGFNRTPHYTRGLLFGRGHRRFGQPVQRRGHPYAMESGKLARPGCGSGAWPPVGSTTRARSAAYPAAMARRVGRLLPPRRRFREAHRPASGHACSHPPRSAASGSHALSAQAVANLYDPATAMISDRTISRPDPTDPQRCVRHASPLA